ncbi:agouti-signaling protein 2b [Ictalurus furcatus]|uniref:agouti-signaling protein 2b n=1 Tax=Ictalurus furcatus TaxID=66913 RepID=UPI002350F5ED|nr:agouti-signaling protein 2b [Ictalurus furcatus]
MYHLGHQKPHTSGKVCSPRGEAPTRDKGKKDEEERKTKSTHMRKTQPSALNSLSGTVNEDQPIGIFSRRRSLPPQRQHVPVSYFTQPCVLQRPRPEAGSANSGSVRHCARLMETCSAHAPCCNPCALCHCRLFNTICQCWRVGVCSRKN